MLKYEITDVLRTQMLNIRKELNLTSAEIGKIIGKSSSAYNSMENGTSNSITHTLLINMFKAAKLAEDGKEYKDAELTGVYVDGLSEFIIKRLDIVLSTYSVEVLQDEIWFQSLYLENKTVGIDKKISEDLKKSYGTDDWKTIFSSLNKNPSIARKFIYKEKNLPYVEHRTEDEKKQKNCPVWACLYDLSDSDIDEMADRANKGKINVAVLFTLFLNHSVKHDIDIENHFDKVAVYFYKNTIPLICNDLDMVKKPVLDNYISNEWLKVVEFFNNLEITNNDEGLSNLRENVLDANTFFANAISFNFSFLKRISPEQRIKLHNMMDNAIIEFRKEENV